MGLVNIKSYQSGINLILDSEGDFADILDEIAVKFEESKRFFKNAKIALSIEGRSVTENQEKIIVSTIERHSGIEVLCLIGKDELTNKRYIKALKRVESQREENNSRLYKGMVEEGDIVEAEGNLIVIGDVCKGGGVAATKDIIVLGGLYGTAIAGTENSGKNFISALDLAPEKASVNSVKFKPKGKSIFSRKKDNSGVLVLEDGEVKVRSLDSETFYDLL